MKTRKLLTADPGAEVDRRARAYLAKHPKADYAEAMRAVCKAAPALARSYLDEPRFRELRLLADFLNSAPDKNLREELLSDMLPLLSERHSPSPALALAQKLNSMDLTVRCVPVLDPKSKAISRFSFSVTPSDPSLAPRLHDALRTALANKPRLRARVFNALAPTLRNPADCAQIYATLASALQSGDFNRLRRCPTCETFFVALDHRKRFCEKSECEREARRKSAREGMRKKRASTRKAPKGENPLERFLEFMRVQRKANPTEEELKIISAGLRALGGKDVARKQLAAWEEKFRNRPKAIWRELTEEQREIFRQLRTYRVEDR